MKSYLIQFNQTIDNIDTPTIHRYWRCNADDYDHAIEQLQSEVCGCQGEKVTFHELLECTDI